AVCSALATAGFVLAQATAPVVGTLDGHTDAVYAIAWSPDGKALVTGGFDSTVRLWDAATRKEIKRFDGHTGLVLAVAPAPDGKARTIRLWKADGSPDGQIETPAATVLGLAYLPRNQRLVSAGSDGLARLWQLPVAAPRVIAANAAVTLFAASSDGNTFATAN